MPKDTPEARMHREEIRGAIALVLLFLSASAAWGVLWVMPNNARLAAVQDCTLESQFDNTDPEEAWSICFNQVNTNRE
jgi:hypothetical protein